MLIIKLLIDIIYMIKKDFLLEFDIGFFIFLIEMYGDVVLFV